MKKKIAAILVISALLLSGCSSKDALIKGSNDAGSSGRVEVKTDFKAVDPGTVPQLSETLKSEVNSKFNPTMNNLKNAMNSIQDAQDIDLNSIK